MENNKDKLDSIYRPGWRWLGRSLDNYINLHSKAKGAPTLTQAKRMAFGTKAKSFTCKCGETRCTRDSRGESHC